jgi:hypothetical protein
MPDGFKIKYATLCETVSKKSARIKTMNAARSGCRIMSFAVECFIGLRPKT